MDLENKLQEVIGLLMTLEHHAHATDAKEAARELEQARALIVSAGRLLLPDSLPGGLAKWSWGPVPSWWR